MSNKSGIYQIINIVNDKRYIGSASWIRKRRENHFSSLRDNKHKNKKLQSAYNKYGVENFEFQILLYCNKEDLIFYEQIAINIFDLKTELYNIRNNAENNFGIKRSEEFRKKLSISKQGIKLSQEHKNKIGESGKGRIVSEETKLKISISNQGKIISEETREIWSLQRKGRKLSNETRKRIGDSVRGEKNYRYGKSFGKLKESTRIKIGNAHRGEKNNNYNKFGKDHPSSKPVYQIDANTNIVIKEWESASEVKRNLGIGTGVVSVCKGKRKTAGGFKWAYVKNYPL